jgi:hypothetical protein
MMGTELSLAEKGKFALPPRLLEPAQSVSEAVASWDEIISATHWLLDDPEEVDGADFYVGERELGHIHLDGEIHLALSKPLTRRLVELGVGHMLRWDRRWIVFPIDSASAASTATWLFRLGYDRIRGVPEKILLERIDAGVP